MRRSATIRCPVAAAALLAALLLLAPAVRAPAVEPADAPASAADAAAVRQVIQAQLDAFRRDDGPAAFSYAAPRIQAMFGTPEAFMNMVRGGYAPVYRPQQVIFQGLAQYDGEWVQTLMITARDGHVLLALYAMEQQPDGSWRISGVTLQASDALGA